MSSLLDQPFHEAEACFGWFQSPESNSQTHNNSKNSDGLSTHEQQKKQEIENMLSDAMKNLSFNERQEQQEVLHGVEDKIKEEATFIDATLRELDNLLNQTKGGSVYEIAESMDPQYVQARSLRLMFLRGNRYDVIAAANQMIRFFAQKEKIFGTQKLTKDITMEDLDEDDLEFLKSGCIQLGGNDRAGRQLIFQFPGIRNFKTLQNELRTRYYITMSALESDEVQLRGASVTTYTVGEYRDNKEGGGYLQNMQLAMSLPIFISANLLCCDEYAEYLLGSVAVKAMPVKLRARFRMLYGSHMECRYQLSTFGISPQLIPLHPMTNTLRLAYHLNWYHSRLPSTFSCSSTATTFSRSSTVSSDQSETGAIEIKSEDVLFRGGKTSNNGGNQRLRNLVKSLVPVYVSATNDKKRVIVNGIISEIHNSGGRFLKEVTGGGQSLWIELSIDDSRTRITQSFRNQRRRPDRAGEKEAAGTLIGGMPTENDIIFGNPLRSRGRELLQLLIKEQAEDYDALDRGMKVKVVDAIIQRIRSEGGRFLLATPDHDGYLEVSNEMVRARVRKSFRNNRRCANRKAKK